MLDKKNLLKACSHQPIQMDVITLDVDNCEDKFLIKEFF